MIAKCLILRWNAANAGIRKTCIVLNVYISKRKVEYQRAKYPSLKLEKKNVTKVYSCAGCTVRPDKLAEQE